jgi:hypothetical protein
MDVPRLLDRRMGAPLVDLVLNTQLARLAEGRMGGGREEPLAARLAL